MNGFPEVLRIRRTSYRVKDYDSSGESQKLIVTFDVSPDMFKRIQDKNPSALNELYRMAPIAPVGSGGPGSFFANPPRIILGQNGRVALTQFGGLDV